MVPVRVKMLCTYKLGAFVQLEPIDCEENKRVFEGPPNMSSGVELTPMSIETSIQFEAGKEYFVDFVPAAE